MNDGRDESSDMRSFPLDEDTAERLLDGGLSPEDAPLGWERVALLVGVASGPAEESEVADELTIIAAMADVVLGDAAGEPAGDAVGEAEIVSLDSRRTGTARFRTARVAGIAAVVVLLSGTAAAAATDVLPRPAQRAVSNVAAHVGVTLPKPLAATDHDADDVTVPGAPSTPRPADHDPKLGAASTSVASTALCRSATAADLDAGTTPDTDDLGVAAAADRESVADFCRGLTPAVPAKTSATTVQGLHNGGASDGGQGDGGSSPSAQPSAGDQGQAQNQDGKGQGGAQGQESGTGGRSDAGNNQGANNQGVNNQGGHNGQGNGQGGGNGPDGANSQGDSGQGGGNGQGQGNGGQGHSG